ncbi:MAG: caspase family protein [Ignavibacteria bacterium]|nr:caspase family protein [Ignavibacteria bacterium]
MVRIFFFLLFAFTLFAQAPELKVELKNTSQVYCLAVSDDGKFLATGSIGKVFIWDLEEGRLINCIKNLIYPVYSMGFTTDSKSLLMAMGNNNVELWDLETLTKTTTYFGHSYMVKELKVAKNGKYFVSLDYKNKIILWDINKGKALREFEPASALVHSVDFSPSGKEIIIGQMEGTIPVIELASGKEVKKINGTRTTSDDYKPGMSEDSLMMMAVRDYSIGNIVLHEAGKVIAFHANMITQWDLATEVQEKFVPLKFTPYRATATKDGKKVALRGGKALKLLDRVSMKITDSITLSPNDFQPLAVDPKGKYFLTGEMDGSVKFFETQTGKEVMTLFAFDSTDWAVVTPDGYFDASQGAMGLLYYVQELDIIPLEAYFEQSYIPSLFRSVRAGGDSKSYIPTKKEIFTNVMVPPSVKLTSTNESKISKNPEETVNITISDEGGGIDELRLYQNGKLVDVKYYKDNKPKAGNKIKEVFPAQLTVGNNIFKASAFSKGRLEGKSNTILIKYDAPKPVSNLYILAIGVNEYENSKYNLNFAGADAELISKEISGVKNNIFKSVVVKTLYDTEATIKNVRAALDTIVANAKPEDTFVFYFSGHGASDDDPDQNMQEFYFILHEVQQIYGNPSARNPYALSGKEMKEYSLKIKAQKQLILIDACQSGQALENFAMRGAQSEKAIIDLSKSRGLYIMAASEADQTAKEIKDLGHGVFTFSLIEGLKCAADFFDKDGVINVKELNMFVNKKVKETAQKFNITPQRPVSWEYLNDFPIKVCD